MDLATLRGSAEDLKVTARHELVVPVLSTPPATLKCDYQRLPVHRPKGPLRRADIRGKGRPDQWRIARYWSRDGLAFRAGWRIPDDCRAQAGGPGRKQGHDPDSCENDPPHRRSPSRPTCGTSRRQRRLLLPRWPTSVTWTSSWRMLLFSDPLFSVRFLHST